MKKLLFSLLLFFTATAVRSQDSLVQVIQQIITEDSLIRDEMRFNRDGLLLPVRGVIQTFTHQHFNELPGPYRYNNHRWEDYGVALTPLAATWIMKICGVKSRSTTRRMLTANAAALGLTVGISQVLRWNVREERPDERGSNSFPSVHASLAYMGATVLSREYGHISPWITIGGYTVATGTQMLRIGHNAHWMNDIFMGAGIGVVSTHVAYFLTDQIFRRKGIRPMQLSSSEQAQLQGWNYSPSGFRLISGTETNGRSIEVESFATAAEGFDMTGIKLRSSASITSGFEAEWFVTDDIWLSAIGRLTMSQAKLEIPRAGLTAWGEQIHLYHGDIAAGWMMPRIPVRKGGAMRFGVRTLWGVRYNEGVTFHRVAPGKRLGEDLLYIKPQLRPAGGAGINIDMLQSHNQTLGFTIDYLHTFGTHFLANRWVIASSWKAIF
ncbi:MAG: phosphatase PAP2 family protein [Bacteroidaceae bacterium]|nr:phosphatase PAP2 family protein [Bacteroidaceae bacterium]